MSNINAFNTVFKFRCLLIQCSSCGQFLISENKQKTKRCTYCNARLQVSIFKILARTPTAKGASELVMVLKEKGDQHSKQG